MDYARVSNIDARSLYTEFHYFVLNESEFRALAKPFVNGKLAPSVAGQIRSLSLEAGDIPRSVRLSHYKSKGESEVIIFPEGAKPRDAIHYDFKVFDKGLARMESAGGLRIKIGNLIFRFIYIQKEN